MAEGENKIIRRRLAGAWISTVISISLVLLLVGIASLLLVNAKNVSDYFKENMQVSVMMMQEVGEDEAGKFQQQLDSMPFVRETRFISKAQGAKEMVDMLGEDFLDVFESTPIPVSIDVTLKADYVSADSLKLVEKKIMKSPMVDDVVYQQSLVEKLNTNLQKVSLILGVFILLLLFISFVLINNTVRLNVFSKRFTIHAMQLVGASKSFIRGPFLVQSVFQGLFSALIAIILLVGILFFIRNEFEQLFSIFSLDLLLIVLGIVVAAGILICFISTYFVVGKLLRLSKNELYY
ncbi:MAG: permease-like cell division protein FtsX [Bacteroidales bacterium]|nr:permease-like cell division protein FtsX [Bacteroidales bacterium]MDY6000770.1 permease-like cell division protein FtsX [Candidatus Cryptobacteroides sp.]